MRFFHYLWIIVKSIVSLMTLTGLIGGLNADIPGVSDDESMQGLIGACSRALLFSIWLATHYPDGVIIGVVAVAVCITLYEHIKNSRRAAFLERKSRIKGLTAVKRKPSTKKRNKR
ncbi:hypothetical protein [Neorhizobium sp. JUb45]|uniref:hypothetical protein n=1 Tax=Neorhizobium sp. JUb45 TaxID=2485113 RepID=UPI001045F61C|nr:hypothetical protein [Neorhizobium sp. JUb45]